MINVKADVKEVTRYLSRIEKKQVPFATALSLTRTVQHVKSKTLPKVFPRIFDRPSPWVSPNRSLSPKSKRGGFYIMPATKRRWTAEVKIKDDAVGGVPAFNILKPQIEGGRRRAKSHELQLRRLGILRPNEFTVPGDAMRLNRFGNLTGNTYSKILADVQAKSYRTNASSRYDLTAGQATLKKGKKKYFYDPNLKPRAIWERFGRGGKRIRPALLFISSPRYIARFDFHGISARASRKVWPREFRKALARALRTAR